MGALFFFYFPYTEMLRIARCSPQALLLMADLEVRSQHL
jgi:hypothetical protein